MYEYVHIGIEASLYDSDRSGGWIRGGLEKYVIDILFQWGTLREEERSEREREREREEREREREREKLFQVPVK